MVRKKGFQIAAISVIIVTFIAIVGVIATVGIGQSSVPAKADNCSLIVNPDSATATSATLPTVQGSYSYWTLGISSLTGYWTKPDGKILWVTDKDSTHQFQGGATVSGATTGYGAYTYHANELTAACINSASSFPDGNTNVTPVEKDPHTVSGTVELSYIVPTGSTVTFWLNRPKTNTTASLSSNGGTYGSVTGLPAIVFSDVGSDTVADNGSWNPSSYTGAGTYTYTVGTLTSGSDKYNLTNSGATLNFVVSKATPDYTVPTNLTATIGQTLADVVLPDNWSWDDDSTSVGDVGSHEFAATYNPDSNNYNDINENLTVTVSKATPDYIVPTNLAATYGQTLADVALPDGWAWNDALTTSVGNAGTNTFAATFTPDDTETYAIVEQNLTVTVSKKTLTIVAKAKVKTYGEADPELTYTATGLVGNDEISGALIREEGNGVGTYDITVGTLAASDNYAIAFTGAALTINKKSLVIKADDVKVVCGNKPKDFTSTFNGLVNGDKAEDLGKVIYACSYTVESATGTYDITPSGVTNNNYDIVFVAGKLYARPVAIEKKEVQVTIKDGDEGFDLDITLVVEVKTSTKVEDQEEARAEIPEDKLDKNSLVAAIYTVKLVRTTTTDGVSKEEEIQPKDIKPGTNIVVAMQVPESVKDRDFTIMHIHSAEDTEYVDYTREGDTVYVTVNRLSDFAFIVNDSRIEVFGKKLEQDDFTIYLVLLFLLIAILITLIIIILALVWQRDGKDDNKRYRQGYVGKPHTDNNRYI